MPAAGTFFWRSDLPPSYEPTASVYECPPETETHALPPEGGGTSVGTYVPVSEVLSPGSPSAPVKWYPTRCKVTGITKPPCTLPQNNLHQAYPRGKARCHLPACINTETILFHRPKPSSMHAFVVTTHPNKTSCLPRSRMCGGYPRTTTPMCSHQPGQSLR